MPIQVLGNNNKILCVNGHPLQYKYLLFSEDNKNIVERCNYTLLPWGVSVTATSTYGRASFIFPVISGKSYNVEFDSTATSDSGIYKMIYFSNKELVSGEGWTTEYGSIAAGGHKTKTFTANTDVLFIGVYVTATTTTGTVTLTNVELTQVS